MPPSRTNISLTSSELKSCAIDLPVDGPSVLACGSETNNRFCITSGRKAYLSPKMGDLTDYGNFEVYRRYIADAISILNVHPEIVAFDMHPDYVSTRYALNSGIKQSIAVQHHHAHIASCMAEYGINDKIIGVALDGTGYSPDGTIWGGEFLISNLCDFERIAHFKQYCMPGGEEAIRSPFRMALSYLYAEAPDYIDAFKTSLAPNVTDADFQIIMQLIEKKIRSPITSSAGRLFDAVSALTGVCRNISYQGEAAITLQAIANKQVESRYDFELFPGNTPIILSFGPMIRQIISDLSAKKDQSFISGKFHNTIAEGVAETCALIRSRDNINNVALSGGVFQNSLLLTLTTNKLSTRDFKVYTHNLIPSSDAGLAIGQAIIALSRGST